MQMMPKSRDVKIDTHNSSSKYKEQHKKLYKSDAIAESGKSPLKEKLLRMAKLKAR